MKKRDLLLLLFLLAAAGLLAAFGRFFPHGGGAYVRVTVDGALYGEYRLSEDRVVEVESAYGYNRLVIAGGAAYMELADCPDRYCMSYAPISRTGESIVCLPHRLVAEVRGAGETELDAVAQ